MDFLKRDSQLGTGRSCRVFISDWLVVQPYNLSTDELLKGGRGIDPENKMDCVMDVAMAAGKRSLKRICAYTEEFPPKWRSRSWL